MFIIPISYSLLFVKAMITHYGLTFIQQRYRKLKDFICDFQSTYIATLSTISKAIEKQLIKKYDSY